MKKRLAPKDPTRKAAPRLRPLPADALTDVGGGVDPSIAEDGGWQGFQNHNETLVRVRPPARRGRRAQPRRR